MNGGESIMSVDNQLLRNQDYLVAIGQSLYNEDLHDERGEKRNISTWSTSLYVIIALLRIL